MKISFGEFCYPEARPYTACLTALIEIMGDNPGSYCRGEIFFWFRDFWWSFGNKERSLLACWYTRARAHTGHGPHEEAAMHFFVARVVTDVDVAFVIVVVIADVVLLASWFCPLLFGAPQLGMALTCVKPAQLRSLSLISVSYT